jgi:hypothetical protein
MRWRIERSKASDGEAAKQCSDDRAGKINREQRYLRGKQPRLRDWRVGYGQPAVGSDQLAGGQNREVRGGGSQPAFAEPVF